MQSVSIVTCLGKANMSVVNTNERIVSRIERQLYSFPMYWSDHPLDVMLGFGICALEVYCYTGASLER